MERLAHAALGVDRIAVLDRKHEGRDARHLGLPGEHLQIEHHLDVILEVARYAHRRRRQVQVALHLLAGEGDAPLHLAHVGQILVETLPVGGRKIALEARGLAHHAIENARGLLATGGAGVGILAVAEQPLEHHLRIALQRQRRVLVPPGEAVAIGAAPPLATSRGTTLQPELQRGQRRVLTDMPHSDLIGRHAQPVLVLVHRRAAQIAGAAARMIGGGRGVLGIGQRQRHAAHHVDPVPIGFERTQRGRHGEVGALRRRGPLVHHRAVRDVIEAEPGALRRAGLADGGRQHGLQEGQRQRNATHAAQQRAAGQVPLGDIVHLTQPF